MQIDRKYIGYIYFIYIRKKEKSFNMGTNGVNLNSLSLAEKIKLLRQQQGNGQKTVGQTQPQTDKMNTSIFSSNTQTRSVNSQQSTTANAQTRTVNSQQTTGGVLNRTVNAQQATSVNTGTSTTGTQPKTSMQRALENAQNSAASAKPSYENPGQLQTKQEITQALTELRTKMMTEGTNGKLEGYERILESKLDKLDEEAKTNGANGQDSTNPLRKQNSGASAADASAAQAEAEAGGKEVQNEQKTSESNTKEAQSLQKSAKSERKSLQKDEKALDKQMKTAQKNLDKGGKEINEISAKMDENQVQIDAALSEIQTLQTAGADSTGVGENSAFSLKLAGEDQGNQAGETKGMNAGASTGGASAGVTTSNSTDSTESAAKVQSLQAQIDEKVAENTELGIKMDTVQTSNNKNVRTMNNTVRMKQKYYTKVEKNLKKDEEATNKAIEVEKKIEDIAVTVQKVGDITNKVGQVTYHAGVALSSNPTTAAAGQTMMRVGTTVQKVGTQTENIGKIGQAASQTAQAATYAAQGDIGKALTTAGSAIQTGAAAAKATKNMDKTMEQLDEKLQEGLEKSATAAAAQEAAKQAAESGALNGMTEKEYAKNAKAQLDGLVENNTLDRGNLASIVDGENAGEQVNGMLDKENLATAASDRAAKQAQQNAGKGGGESLFNKAGDWLADNGEKAGEQLSQLGQKYTAKNQSQTQQTQQTQTQQGQYATRPDFSNRRAQAMRKGIL